MADPFNEHRTLQRTHNATFNPPLTVPETYTHDADFAQGLAQGTIIVDRTHWTRLEVTGDDRLSFLHNQTTQDFKTRQPGQGCLAVIVTAAARTIDLTLGVITDNGVLLLAAPEMGDALISWFDRYIFPMDRVSFSDKTAATATFSLLGATSRNTLVALGFTDIDSMEAYDHQTIAIGDGEVRAIAHSGLARPGYTLWTSADNAAPLWQKLTELGAVPAGETQWETWRIEDGVPKCGQELTDSYNPLEAGLWHAVSIDKGCYIGQEIIARLNTRDGVQQCLYGVQLNGPQPPGAKLLNGKGDRAGVITSCQSTDDGAVGLAYIRRKQCDVGARFTIANDNQDPGTGTLVDMPFAVRSNPAAKDKLSTPIQP
ncbi:MAG: YgfZ/GcvT domain-containing protein [Cyanophyceae cyanobacterium]